MCKGRWVFSGIPEHKVDEMSAELEDHLREALADGQSVEDVTGEDVLGFAEDWSRPNLPRKPIAHEMLDVLWLPCSGPGTPRLLPLLYPAA